jgi:S1-C subfamily serine protease
LRKETLRLLCIGELNWPQEEPIGLQFTAHGHTLILVAGLLGATAADLTAGDVIVAINGKPLRNSQELRRTLAALKPGDAVVLEVERQSVLQYVAFEME